LEEDDPKKGTLENGAGVEVVRRPDKNEGRASLRQKKARKARRGV